MGFNSNQGQIEATQEVQEEIKALRQQNRNLARQQKILTGFMILLGIFQAGGMVGLL